MLDKQSTTLVINKTPLPLRDPWDSKVQGSMMGVISEMGLDFITDPVLKRKIDHESGWQFLTFLEKRKTHEKVCFSKLQ